VQLHASTQTKALTAPPRQSERERERENRKNKFRKLVNGVLIIISLLSEKYEMCFNVRKTMINGCTV
jgi:hypothetical protein